MMQACRKMYKLVIGEDVVSVYKLFLVICTHITMIGYKYLLF